MRIGFAGHRPNRIKLAETRIRARLVEVLGVVLRAVRAAHPSEPLIALSPLAEGSDRNFADAALQSGMTLHAVLPLPSADYETTFDDPATRAAYRTLLGRAQDVSTLPGTLADVEAAYEAVGHAMVNRSDVLIVVWDGEPAAGRGGTTAIIAYALLKSRPVIWVDAAIDQPPQWLLGRLGRAGDGNFTRADVLAEPLAAHHGVDLTKRVVKH